MTEGFPEVRDMADHKDVHVHITRRLTLASIEGGFLGLFLYQPLSSDP